MGRELQLIDIQNLFCEVDKYTRRHDPSLSSGTAVGSNSYRLLATLSMVSPKWASMTTSDSFIADGMISGLSQGSSLAMVVRLRVKDCRPSRIPQLPAESRSWRNMVNACSTLLATQLRVDCTSRPATVRLTCFSSSSPVCHCLLGNQPAQHIKNEAARPSSIATHERVLNRSTSGSPLRFAPLTPKTVTTKHAACARWITSWNLYPSSINALSLRGLLALFVRALLQRVREVHPAAPSARRGEFRLALRQI